MVLYVLQQDIRDEKADFYSITPLGVYHSKDDAIKEMQKNYDEALKITNYSKEELEEEKSEDNLSFWLANSYDEYHESYSVIETELF